MKHKQFIFVTALLFLVLANTGCSFKSDDSEAPQVSGSQAVQFDPQEDSDGDRILNGKEVELGFNPLIADIPKLQARFLQNYTIDFTYKKPQREREYTGSIDTRVGRQDPDFKYRVGSILVRDQSLKEAARIGQFSGHSWGEIKQRDLSWIKFPDVDPVFYHKNQLEYADAFFAPDSELLSLTIKLENTVKLLPHPLFTSIKDLELNFYYYSYERETWELIGSKLVERVFGRDQTETFEVTLENVPAELMRDNYLKRGEFIVSEIKDFKIGDSGLTYQQLMQSVSAKSVQLILNTPRGIEQNYIAANAQTTLPALLSALYDKQFRLQDNELVKINAFENNLPEYTYLKEVKELDKKGRWFTFTKRLNRHYLDYNFKAGEAVILSYVTGSDLAKQNAESFLSLRQDIGGNDNFTLYPLGNVTSNSNIKMYLRPKRQLGDQIITVRDSVFTTGGGCGRNCMSQDFRCNLEINSFKERQWNFVFKSNFSEEISQITLVINQNEYSFKELYDAQKVKMQFSNEGLYIEIPDIEQIQELLPAQENLVLLKLKTEHGSTFNGVKLTAKSGRDSYMCSNVVMNYAGVNGLPLSVDSLDFATHIAPYVNWSRVKRGENRAYSKPFEIDVAANVSNFYN